MAMHMRVATPARADATWLHGTVAAMRRGWRAYWERRAQRATVVLLQSLNAETLRDIGVTRNEIESVVYGTPAERRHQYRATCE